MEDNSMWSGEHIPQAGHCERASYSSSAPDAPVEHYGMYYFDPELNQPVSSATWSTGDCSAPQDVSNCGAQNVPKMNRQRGYEDRNRRKGEPFRYARRYYNRVRPDWGQSSATSYYECSAQASSDTHSSSMPRRPRKPARERRNSPQANDVSAVEAVNNGNSLPNPSARPFRKHWRGDRQQRRYNFEEDEQGHSTLPDEASNSGPFKTSQRGATGRNRSPRSKPRTVGNRPAPPRQTKQDYEDSMQRKEGREGSLEAEGSKASHPNGGQAKAKKRPHLSHGLFEGKHNRQGGFPKEGPQHICQHCMRRTTERPPDRTVNEGRLRVYDLL